MAEQAGMTVADLVESVRQEVLRDHDEVRSAVEAAVEEVVGTEGRDAVVLDENPLTLTERAAGQVRGLATGHFAGDVD